MNVEVPSTNISSGMDVEKKSFTWSIGNFPILRMHKHMIESQRFPFTAGETTGHPSQWTVYLTETKRDEKRWIGIFLGPTSPKPTDAASRASYYDMRWTIKNKKGEIVKERGKESEPNHIATVLDEGSGRGFLEFIDPDDVNLATEESLVIQMTFRLYTPSQTKLTSSLEAIKEKFQVTFSEKLREDFVGLLEIPDPCKDIKLISSDEKEFSMKKGILAARSEVFAAMFRADMAEAKSGVIPLPEISSKALKVLLNFIKTGELLPEWSEPEVIVELTNAAGKYELQDLLRFLDEAVGKVCQLENVLDLAVLARQLSLKLAEEELMMFVRKEGVRSLDNVFQICSTEIPGIDSVPTPGAAANKERKQKKVHWFLGVSQ